MPAVQTSYPVNISRSKPGHVPNMLQADEISRNVETVAGVAFGAPVAQGADPLGCIAYAGTGFIGVAVRERSIRHTAADIFLQYDSARILRKGPISVLANVNVVAGDPVYVTAAGLFTNVATSNFLIPNSRWETTTTAGNVGDIFIK